MYNKKAIAFIISLCAAIGSQLHAKSYSCGAVYPSEVYCPAGMICAFAAPTCIMSIGAIGGSSITEERYAIKRTNPLTQIKLDESKKLPLDQYPEFGEQQAFQLTPTEGKFPNVPFTIVIQTEIPNEKFINKIERGIKQLTDQTQIKGAQELIETLKNLKNENQGVNTVYRSIPAFGERDYKLYYVRVPKQSGYIIARADGDLEFHEKDPKNANKELITVIDTGVLMDH